MAIKKGLGKGLDALLGDYQQPPEESVKEIDVNLIDTNSSQPRKSFDKEKLDELANSIKNHGIVQPIVVRRTGERYTIVAGERRYRAARIAGLNKVPVVVKDMDDYQVMEVALIENIQREDLNPIEEAEGYQLLMSQYNMTQEETAQRVGKSRSAVANALRLLNLCEPVRAMVEDGRLSGGHARSLLPLPAKQQETAAAAVLKSELSVRQTELLAKKLMAETPEKPAKGPLSVNYAEEAARELGERLGRGCRIVSGRKKGRIELEYYGTDDLNDLLDALHAIKKK